MNPSLALVLNEEFVLKERDIMEKTVNQKLHF